MPHSLRVKIKGLRYKGIITDKDCDRLCKALDNENVLEQIRDEIVEWRKEPAQYIPNYYAYKRFLELIDKYR